MVGKKFKRDLDFKLRFLSRFRGESRLRCFSSVLALASKVLPSPYWSPAYMSSRVVLRCSPSQGSSFVMQHTFGQRVFHQHPRQAIQTSQSAKWLLDKSKQLECDRNSAVSGWEPQWIADCTALLREAGQLQCCSTKK